MFDPEKLYRPDDPSLRPIGSYSVLAHWRHQNRGPDYVRLGKRIVYSGAALNEFLSRRTVRTARDTPVRST